MNDFFKEDAGGKNSSKKISGLIFFAICIIMALVDQFTIYELNAMVWTTLFFGGMTLVGAKTIKDVIQKK